MYIKEGGEECDRFGILHYHIVLGPKRFFRHRFYAKFSEQWPFSNRQLPTLPFRKHFKYFHQLDDSCVLKPLEVEVHGPKLCSVFIIELTDVKVT